jgi:hypothetical protein
MDIDFLIKQFGNSLNLENKPAKGNKPNKRQRKAKALKKKIRKEKARSKKINRHR